MLLECLLHLDMATEIFGDPMGLRLRLYSEAGPALPPRPEDDSRPAARCSSEDMPDLGPSDSASAAAGLECATPAEPGH